MHQAHIFLWLGLSLLLWGCSGAYRDPQARTIGHVTDDLAIGTKIKRRLLMDKTVSALRINVDVHQGQVTLRGPVPNQAAGEHAVRLAEEVKGVIGVTNRTRPRN